MFLNKWIQIIKLFYLFYRFLDVFKRIYSEPLQTLYTAADTDWLFSIIRRELEVKNPDTDHVTKDSYDGKSFNNGNLMFLWMKSKQMFSS